MKSPITYMMCQNYTLIKYTYNKKSCHSGSKSNPSNDYANRQLEGNKKHHAINKQPNKYIPHKQTERECFEQRE